MAAVEQDIRVKVTALVRGLNELRAFSRELSRLRNSQGSSSQALATEADASNVGTLAAEVRNLSSEIQKLEPSRLQRFTGVISNIARAGGGLAQVYQALRGGSESTGASSGVLTRIFAGLSGAGARLSATLGQVGAGLGRVVAAAGPVALALGAVIAVVAAMDGGHGRVSRSLRRAGRRHP